MSSRRSRSGGTRSSYAIRRCSSGSRKRPLFTAPSRSASVALSTRTSTRRVAAADPLHLTALEHAQQQRLQRFRQIADLVEQQAAAVGLLEEARARPYRPP